MWLLEHWKTDARHSIIMDEHDKKNLAEILFRASPVTLTSSVLALRSEVLQFYEHREMATRFTNQTTLHAFMSVSLELLTVLTVKINEYNVSYVY